MSAETAMMSATIQLPEGPAPRPVATWSPAASVSPSCPESLLDSAMDLLRIALDQPERLGRSDRHASLRWAYRLLEVDRDRRRPAFARGGLAPWQVARVTAYVDARLGQRLSVVDLANVVRLSPSRTSKCFLSTFGASPGQFVLERRIACAMTMIEETNEPLSQIALACGFCDQPHFTRRFRAMVGVTPRTWRQRRSADLAEQISPTLEVA
jgi:AraC-like DNA-binding protein